MCRGGHSDSSYASTQRANAMFCRWPAKGLYFKYIGSLHQRKCHSEQSIYSYDAKLKLGRVIKHEI